jgi:predicted nicotinamide N-methyase
VTIAGRPLTLAQRPRDVRPRKGGAGETGLVLWGAALLLTWHLEHTPSLRAKLASGASVLELGCGAGLCAAAAALLGGAVTATDGDDEVVALAAENAAQLLADAARERTETPSIAHTSPLGAVTARRLRWGDAADAAALAPPYELIIASDVIYFVEAHDALLATLVMLAAASPGCEVLLAHTWRKPDAEGAFFARLTGAEGGFACEDVTPADDAPGDPPRPHGTRLLRLWQAKGGAPPLPPPAV